MFSPTLFDSFFLGGFECSTHRRYDGKRLDVIAASEHDVYARSDYKELARLGIRTVRDGLRWHLIEATPGTYDWSSFVPMLQAARETRTQVLWDLCHYGWPDHVDFWSPEFVASFARFAGAAAKVVQSETDAVPFYVPVNEISFWSWAGGHMGIFNPFVQERGDDVKCQLVRASIAAIEAIRSVDPRARIVHIEPLINEIPLTPEDAEIAEAYRLYQYQAWDMLAGTTRPELGGRRDYIDIIGVNYYSANQRYFGGAFVEPTHPMYRPFSDMLAEAYHRYERPIFIAETGIEFEERPDWLRLIGHHAREAIRQGVPVEGLCWYPILNHPGWDDDRHTEGGLLDYVEGSGSRIVYEPLAAELKRQQRLFDEMLAPSALAASGS